MGAGLRSCLKKGGEFGGSYPSKGAAYSLVERGVQGGPWENLKGGGGKGPEKES